MEHRQITADFFDLSLRFETIIHIATMCAERFPDAARDAFEGNPERVFKALGFDEVPEEADDPEELSAWLYRKGKGGFLVQVATPVPFDFSRDGKSHSTNGWGYYQTDWLYAETYEELIPAALKWQKGYHARIREGELSDKQ